MDIKEIALKVAEEMPSGFLWYEGCGHEAGILIEEVVEFAEALIAELAKQNEPVAWCVGYDDPRMGRIHSNPTMCKPEAEALVKSTTSELIVCSLYALQPTASQIKRLEERRCEERGIEMNEYNEQAVETLDDAGCIIANKNIIIDNLQARIAELEEENARLKAAVEYAETIRVENIAYFEKQLAASQLSETQLREALQTYIDEHEECQDADDWMAMLCSIEAHHVAEEALALPRDTSALDTYVAEKVKGAKAEVLDQVRHFKRVREQRDLAVEALEKIAAPVRVDGTYNRCREACEILAKETLSAIKGSEAK